MKAKTQSEGYAKSFDGTEIYYTSQGDGLPMVLCDGVGCDGFIWKYIKKDFQNGYRIIHWNYRGHGKSPIPESFDNLTIETNAKDLKAVLDTNKISKGVLLGHSMGVQVILEFYHLYPKKVLGLIPLCGSYGNVLDTFMNSRYFKYIFPYLLNGIISLSSPIQMVWRRLVNTDLSLELAKLIGINRHLIKKEDFWPYLEHLSQVDLRVFVNMVANAGKHSAERYLNKIKVPTLIVAGEHDSFTPLSVSEFMHQRIPKSEILVLRKGRHTGPLEWAELVNLRIEKFLKEKFPPQQSRGSAK